MLSSQKELASEFLTLFKNKFALAMGYSLERSTGEDSNLSFQNVGEDSTIPSERYVAYVLSKFTWLLTSRQYYGTFFGCGWCTEWEENIMEFCNLILKLQKKCKNFCCCESLPDQPCLFECRRVCQCLSCIEQRQKLPTSSKFLALQLLCWPTELSDVSKHEIMKWRFNRMCWTGKCTQPQCLNFGTFFNYFNKLFLTSQKFRFWKYQELERESIGAKTPWIYHGFGEPELLSRKGYVSKMQVLLERYVPRLIALNFGNEQLKHVTDPFNPRLPVGEPLVGVDFSASPNFLHGRMTQLDYQTSQTFGVVSFVGFWVTKDKQLKKAVYPMVFVNPTHCTERICQALDCGLQELEKEMMKDKVQLKNLYPYSDCAPGDQKNKFFLYHISEMATLSGKWLPVRYFQRPGNHNKFDFDSDGTLFKMKYFLAARDPKNKSLQWSKGGLTHGGKDQLKAIVKYMNNPTSAWQKIGYTAKTTVRKAIFLSRLSNTKRFTPFDCKGISKNYAFVTIGYHKIAQRHLMNLSDDCLSKAFSKTPDLTMDEQFCGSWDNVDLSKDAYPHLTGLNMAHRIKSKYERDGKLLLPLRFTPLFTTKARQAVATKLGKRKFRQPINFDGQNILLGNKKKKVRRKKT